MSEWKEWEYTAPPMKPIIEQVVGQMHTEYENGAMKAVQEVGFNVDKDRLIQALTDARKFYEEGYRAAMSRSEWISVDERLPEHGDVVLCFMKFGEQRILQWDNVSNWWLGYGHGDDWQKENVTHWCCLSQPPKEG